MTADNFSFDITGAPLKQALEIAALKWANVKAWRIDADKKRIVLYWIESSKSTPLPAQFPTQEMAPFIEAWIKTLDLGRQPDHDGDNDRGYRVYNEAWGHVDGEYQAFVAIEPVWLMYGK